MPSMMHLHGYILSDAFLMKNEQWFRRVEVNRAKEGEDLSVNLISQDYGRVKN